MAGNPNPLSLDFPPPGIILGIGGSMRFRTITAKAFTLIELMIVVAIIGLLAAIAIPKFADLVIKAKEAAIKGKLGSLRSSISLYYANNEGVYPDYLQLPQCLTTGGKYLDSIPSFSIPTAPGHRLSNGVTLIDWGDWQLDNALAYNTSTAGLLFPGKIIINCSHTDSKGTAWSLW